MEMDLSLEQFLALPEEEQLPYIGRSAILYARQFERADIDELCALADAARTLHAEPDGATRMAGLMRGRMALNFFAQPSTRTFMSFNTAQAYLGLNRSSLRDLAISSMSKGESLVDTIRTFVSYVDLIVMRHPDEKAAPTAFWAARRAHRRMRLPSGDEVPIPIVSGGSGARHHPTQALLDVYTLQRALRDVGGLDGKAVLLVGDLKRGRAVRSLAQMLPHFRDVTLLFAAPERLRILPDITDRLDALGVRWEEVRRLEDALPHADAVYMTRIQDEWDDERGEGHVGTPPDFVFRRRHLDLLRDHTPLLHPLPKRDEIEPVVDELDDPRVQYWQQERNGMWMRVALLARLFGVEGALIGS